MATCRSCRWRLLSSQALDHGDDEIGEDGEIDQEDGIVDQAVQEPGGQADEQAEKIRILGIRYWVLAK